MPPFVEKDVENYFPHFKSVATISKCPKHDLDLSQVLQQLSIQPTVKSLRKTGMMAPLYSSLQPEKWHKSPLISVQLSLCLATLYTVRDPLKLLKEKWLATQPPSTNLLDFVCNFRFKLSKACELARQNLGEAKPNTNALEHDIYVQ